MSPSDSFRTTPFQTSRLLLRPLTPEDAEALYAIRSHRDIFKWTMAGEWHDLSSAHDWVKKQLASESYQFMIELLPPPAASQSVAGPTTEMARDGAAKTPSSSQESPHTVIGSLGMFSWSEDGVPHDNELGYMFGVEHFGRGYATEALRAFTERVWQCLPEVSSMMALVDCENAGSIAVMRKCGFVEVVRREYANVTLGERVGVIFNLLRPGSGQVRGEA